MQAVVDALRSLARSRYPAPGEAVPARDAAALFQPAAIRASHHKWLPRESFYGPHNSPERAGRTGIHRLESTWGRVPAIGAFATKSRHRHSGTPHRILPTAVGGRYINRRL